MNNADDMVWDVLDKSFCKYRVKQSMNETKFCRNKWNLTGFCKCRLCPLANSQYATVREKFGKMYLHVKTAERAHLPRKWWDVIPLSEDLVEAMKQIDENLQWWPRNIIFKCKARVMRIREYLSRMRRLQLHPGATSKLVTVKSKEEKMLNAREVKAERIALLDQSIEKELLNRLRTGVYDSEIPVNIPDSAFLAVIDKELDREDALAAQAQEEEHANETEGAFEAVLGDDLGDAAVEDDRLDLEALEELDEAEERQIEAELGHSSSHSGKRKHVTIGGRSKPSSASATDAKKPKRPKVYEHEIESAVKTLYEW
eukprot:RCo043597